MILLLTVAVSLSGCAETVFKTRLEVFCPSIRTYSTEFNQKLADEVQSLPSSTAMEEALIDYIELRDRIRTCEKAREEI